MLTSLTIEGSAGSLEATLTGNEGEPASHLAVLCHPHPLYGGSMDDFVLGILADALIRRGVTVLRFNFRGAGASEGTYDGAGGEVEDLRAVLNWVRGNHAEPGLLLGGYSFGAAVASEALAESGACHAFLIAPPVGNLATNEPDGSIPVDVFAGDQDAFIDHAALARWGQARIHLIDGADHFFSGVWDALKDELEDAIDEALGDT